MLSKTCARCNRVLPAESFRANDRLNSGLDSWCKRCQNAATAEWRARNPSYGKAEKHMKRQKYADPIAFSLHTCGHIAALAERAIERFERQTGKEAPPYLQAVVQLTEALIREHPGGDHSGRQGTCEVCGTAMPLYNSRHKRCDACRRLRRCPQCGRKKAKTSLLCWDCFVSRGSPRRRRRSGPFAVICSVCSRTFEARVRTQTRCPECQREHLRTRPR